MYKLINGKNILKADAANFIAELNQKEPHHIGFCGTDVQEIYNSLQEDFEDISYENSFVGAIFNGKLIGLIGADVDLEDGSAEVWGPFVDKLQDVDVALKMWEELLRILPEAVKHFILFPNVANKLVSRFAENLHFEQKSDQYILTISESQVLHYHVQHEALSKADYEAFKALHDHTFPNTYYNGQEIVERVNENQKVFVMKEADKLAAYAYVEADPDFADASIEFIAVNPEQRGKGYGKKLLTVAVNWLLNFDTINAITLCVADDNTGAINLYQSSGFKVEHRLHYFTKGERRRS